MRARMSCLAARLTLMWCCCAGAGKPEYSYQYSHRSASSSFSDVDSALMSSHSSMRSRTIDITTVSLAVASISHTRENTD